MTYLESQQNLDEPVLKRLPNTKYKFKICLIGDGGTGKTTFINKVLNGDFIPRYVATIGAVTKGLTLHIGDGSFVEYEVWDTAGQEKNVGLKDGYYIGAIAGFFFFDVTSRESLVNIPKYIQAFKNACGIANPKIFVLGNKVDLIRKRCTAETILQRIKDIEISLVYISAKTNYNFFFPFEKLTMSLFNDPNLVISADIDFSPLDHNYDYLAGPGDNNVNKSTADLVPDQ